MRMPFLALVALAVPALAADDVSLNNEVFVSREVRDVAGRTKTVLQPPKMVMPGDRLVFVLSYRNQGKAPATDFTVTNPIPAAVAYASQASPGELVSADGGRSWGALAALRVPAPGGTMRAATAADVTHIRWTMKTPIPVGGGGKLRFNGIVR